MPGLTVSVCRAQLNPAGSYIAVICVATFSAQRKVPLGTKLQPVRVERQFLLNHVIGSASPGSAVVMSRNEPYMKSALDYDVSRFARDPERRMHCAHPPPPITGDSSHALTASMAVRSDHT